MSISWNKKVLLGVFTLIIGLVLLSLKIVDTTLGSAIVNAGTIITIAAYAHLRNKEEVVQDERTRALGAKAASYSWMFTFIIVAILIWLFQYNLLNIPVDVLLGVLLAEMSLTMLIAKWWISRRAC